MEIINYSDKITYREIIKCISLLPKKYQDLDCKIIVYQNKLKPIIKYLLELDFVFAFYILTNKILGVQRSFKKEIFIYPFKQNKLQIIHTLFHEIRHAYQDKYKNYLFKTQGYCYIGEKHDEHPIEIDANKFARIVMNMKNKEISKILYVDDDWYVGKRK